MVATILPAGALPMLDRQLGSVGPTIPTRGQQAAFEARLLTPPGSGLKPDWPGRDSLPYPFDATRSLADRIAERLARLQETFAPPPPVSDTETPETEEGPGANPGNGSAESPVPSPVLSSVVIEGGNTIEIDRSDGGLVTVTVAGDGSATVETLENGTTVVKSNGGSISITSTTTAAPSMAFSVANGDSILASLAQMRGELS